MIGKRLINTGVAAEAGGLVPSEHFETVTYTGNGGTQRIGGYINRGGVFNGSSSDISLPFNLQNTAFSISFWAKNTLDSNNNYIIANNSGSTQSGWYIGGANSGGTVYNFRINNGASNYLLLDSGTVDDSNWHHVVVTWDNTTNANGAKIYINGSLSSQGTSTSTTNFSFTNSTTQLMREPNGSLRSDGSLDQVRIFNKALSSGEVTTLYGETYASSTISTTDIFNDNSGVALYQLDGNANDTGGVSGYIGEGGIFNGSSSKIDLSNLGLGGAATRTISAWINVNSLSGNRTIFQYGNSAANNRFGFAIESTTGKLYVEYYGRDAITSSPQITVGNWFHVVATYNGGAIETPTNTQIYVNGSAVSMSTTGTETGVANTTDSNYGIGYRRASSTQYFNGKIDQVRIFNKALSSSEVTTLYNETSATASTFDIFSDSSAVALYELDGDARDIGNLYDGTATNVKYAYNGTATNVTYQEATKFQPDLVWIKARNYTSDSYNLLFDSVRGATKWLSSNATAAEGTIVSSLTSFDSNGFSLGADPSGGNLGWNINGYNHVAWTWKAGGAAVTNTDGTITSQVSANTEAGFSIVTYTGNGSAGATVGHGLTNPPNMYIVKDRSTVSNWRIYHSSLGATKALEFNTNAESTNIILWNNTEPTNSVFSLGTFSDINANTKNFIAYCFAEVEGFSKIGSYTGTGGAGNFVETGFEPAFLLIKHTSSSGSHWIIHDNERISSNPRNQYLLPSSNVAESSPSTTNAVNFLSNGFELIGTGSATNGSGQTYIYLAIAADPDTTTPVVENSFDVVTYTGTGSTQEIATDFKPDLVWIKSRSTTAFNVLFDSVRGFNFLSSNTTSAEDTTNVVTLASYDSNGFTTGNDNGTINGSANNYVAWCWKAGDHDDNLPQINTEGSIDSVVSVNAAAGFSIVKWTGNGTSGQSIGHGLSQAPEMIIQKRTNIAGDWECYHKDIGATKKILLNSSAAATTSSAFGNTAPTASVSYAGAYTNTLITYYYFHSVDGYQKIGSYTGNGSSSGTIVNTGFRPRWIMVKSTTFATGWIITDAVRSPSNTRDKYLFAHTNAAEATFPWIDFNDNGFELRDGDNTVNGSGQTYIYLAIK